MIKNYGVLNNDEAAENIHVQNIKRQGFSILKNQIPLAEINSLKQLSENIYADQLEGFGKERIKVIEEENIVRAPFLIDSAFDQLIVNEKVLEIIQSVIGQKIILHLQNVIINRSGLEHHQTAWHRDIPYQNYTLSNPISISALFALTPFNSETGGTKLIPRSHKLEKFPSKDYIQDNFLQPDLEPGDVLIFDSWIYHCAGENISEQDRYGINHVFTAPFLKQQIDFPKLIGLRDFPDKLEELMGEEFEIALSVNDFREKRFKKKFK